jgi:hypothetical protein
VVSPILQKSSERWGTFELVDTIGCGLVQWPPGNFLAPIGKGHRVRCIPFV